MCLPAPHPPTHTHTPQWWWAGGGGVSLLQVLLAVGCWLILLLVLPWCVACYVAAGDGLCAAAAAGGVS